MNRAPEAWRAEFGPPPRRRNKWRRSPPSGPFRGEGYSMKQPCGRALTGWITMLRIRRKDEGPVRGASGEGNGSVPAVGKEGVAEDVIRHLASLCNALGLVEAPVNSQVDAALPVFLFRLRERLKAARDERADLSVIVAGDSVQFVGNESERDLVGAVKPPQGLEQRPGKTRMPGGVGRKRRSKVRPVKIAGRRAHRLEAGVARRVGIAVTQTGRPGTGVGLADAGDRAPELVVEFRLPHGDSAVSQRHVDQRQQPRQFLHM